LAQAIWQFVSNTGHKHKIGLYHGDSTGHLLIYCDSKVVKIDFSVQKPEEYSFFIDDEFCKITLYQEPNGSFTYGFDVDKQTDTPLNQVRKLDLRKNNKLLWAMGVSIVVIIAAFFFGTQAWQRHLSEENSGWAGVVYFPDKSVATHLHESGVKTHAYFYVKPDNQVIAYRFITTEGKRVDGTIKRPEGQIGMLPNGFELQDGDSYQLRYEKGNPYQHMVDFMAPTPEQVKRFAERALIIETRKQDQKSLIARQCFIQTVLTERGWEHLQHIINQFVPPSANSTHNSDSYLRLCRSPDFERVLAQKCWDK
jgi:Fas apoptotic inhibitory molecule (FAIM1)